MRQRARAEEILEFLDLEAWRKRRAADCPYGVQKRVELARALASEPRLLLLDEPVAGLTAEEKEEFSYWIHEIRGRLGIDGAARGARPARRLAPGRTRWWPSRKGG